MLEIVLPVDSAALGILLSAASIAGLKLPIFGDSTSPSGATPAGAAKVPPMVKAATNESSATSPPFTLGEGLPPVPGKLIQKIQRGEYVDMAELLRDNMELNAGDPLARHLGMQPSCQEVPDLISWVQCFGIYAAVVSVSHPDQILQLLAYQMMVVRKAIRCGGRGWQSYDAMFRQQAAISPSVDWSKLNNSLYLTMLLQQQNGRGRTCVHIHCMETDHTSKDCTLAPIHPWRYSAHAKGEPASELSSNDNKRNKGQGTKVCYSWNDGRCSVPYCRYQHICAKCSFPTHKALPSTAIRMLWHNPHNKVGTQRCDLPNRDPTVQASRPAVVYIYHHSSFSYETVFIFLSGELIHLSFMFKYLSETLCL